MDDVGTGIWVGNVVDGATEVDPESLVRLVDLEDFRADELRWSPDAPPAASFPLRLNR